MSKYFNSEIIEELEKRFYDYANRPTGYNYLPGGDTFVLFVSSDPNAKLSCSVITETLKLVCYNEEDCNRFSVQIEKPTQGQKNSNVINSMFSVLKQRGSEDCQSKSERKQQIANLRKSVSSLLNVDDSTYGELPESSSLYNLTKKQGIKSRPQTERRSQFYDIFKAALQPTNKMRKLANMARNYINRTFGQNTTLEYSDEETVSPTMFGPSADEPLASLTEHVNHMAQANAIVSP